MAYRATRSTYRAGRSTARGSVPSLSFGASIAGFGGRIGTRGVSVRIPVASVSGGSSGFRLAAGVPGVARLSVNPTRPSASLRVGPLGVFTSRRSAGASVAIRPFSFGVTTRPLVWARVGDLRIGIPGSLPSGGPRWYDRMNAQVATALAAEGYERRPPSLMEELAEVIDDAEKSAVRAAAEPVAVVRRPVVSPSNSGAVPSFADTPGSRSLARAARRGIPWYRRSERSAASTGALQAAQRLIDGAWDSWHAQDPRVLLMIVNAALAVHRCDAFVLGFEDGNGALLVLVPDFEEVSVEGPAVTNGGAWTVKKRTRAVRRSVHAAIQCAQANHATKVAARTAAAINEWHVMVAELTPGAADIGDLALIADDWFDARELVGGNAFTDHFGGGPPLKRGPKVSDVLDDLVPRAPFRDAPGFATEASTPDALSSADLWLEVAAALMELDPAFAEQFGPVAAAPPEAVEDAEATSAVDAIADDEPPSEVEAPVEPPRPAPTDPVSRRPERSSRLAARLDRLADRLDPDGGSTARAPEPE